MYVLELQKKHNVVANLYRILEEMRSKRLPCCERGAVVVAIGVDDPCTCLHCDTCDVATRIRNIKRVLSQEYEVGSSSGTTKKEKNDGVVVEMKKMGNSKVISKKSLSCIVLSFFYFFMDVYFIILMNVNVI